ncbi:hypothetical protein [Streptomyces litchfieldiae]|uniref:Uncharacterized protein n=1 Tax=Streptomyces litchfieldiae TaxID=3075543 RepID=A0ABU2MR40_9ACTN|nr:hypothetical protein [Streptomyces sp. DSM 44938]MDT0344087.1 hypothetical protein [Streptomyces sp. DSM 44938]
MEGMWTGSGIEAQLAEALGARGREPYDDGRGTERQRVLMLDYRELVERLLGG